MRRLSDDGSLAGLWNLLPVVHENARAPQIPPIDRLHRSNSRVHTGLNKDTWERLRKLEWEQLQVYLSHRQTKPVQGAQNDHSSSAHHSAQRQSSLLSVKPSGQSYPTSTDPLYSAKRNRPNPRPLIMHPQPSAPREPLKHGGPSLGYTGVSSQPPPPPSGYRWYPALRTEPPLPPSSSKYAQYPSSGDQIQLGAAPLNPVNARSYAPPPNPVTTLSSAGTGHK